MWALAGRGCGRGPGPLAWRGPLAWAVGVGIGDRVCVGVSVSFHVGVVVASRHYHYDYSHLVRRRHRRLLWDKLVGTRFKSLQPRRADGRALEGDAGVS